ncbi:MAG: adenine-specific methyltransferase EcoRI family protein [Clostridiales bacterium]|nr:adenine-specific methyltransferase EcoRI family protein [Clostridiales bacterium]
MAGNSNLNNSARNKQDEFYTQLSLIESELKHYKGHFKGKVVLCNCDDPYESNFFKYFAINFNSLGLKKLIATCYVGSPIANTQLSLFDHETPENKTTRTPHKIEISEVDDYTGDGRVGLADVEYLLRNRKNALTRLKGDGDFRSAECIELLKQADIVVTNPPFSLFREYIAQLVEYGKGFLIIGNLNAVKYKEILPLFMTDNVWLGNNSGHYWFAVPDTYEEKTTDFKIDENGQKWRRMGNICWFTNLDFEKRHEDMTLFREYSPDVYPTYDNYDAIEVTHTANIPCDYYGVIGVPITFMTRHNPGQFSIEGVLDSGTGNEYDYAKAVVNGKQLYARILIRRKQGAAQ